MYVCITDLCVAPHPSRAPPNELPPHGLKLVLYIYTDLVVLFRFSSRHLLSPSASTLESRVLHPVSPHHIVHISANATDNILELT